MSIVSQRLRSIAASPTSAMSQRARDLAAAGRDIIRLSGGEPDFDVAPNVERAAMAAIDRHDTRLSPVAGTPEVKRAVIEKLRRDNGLDYEPDEIIVSNGGKQILYSAIFATVDPGDEVVIPAPYWVSYPHMARLAGAEPVFVSCHQNNGFKLRPEDLEAAITPKSKWLVLNSPNNPSGAVYTPDELKALAAVLLRHPHVWVLTDDIYEHLIYGGEKHAAIAAVEPRLKARTLTMNGMSKGYAMPGWRMGYAGGPKELIAAMVKLHSHSASSPNVVSQAATVEALTGDQSYLATHAADYGQRRDLAVEMLNRCPGLHCHRPPGAFYVFPNCAGVLGKTAPSGKVIENDEDFVLELLEEEGVAVVHGAAFGLSPYFRISYAAAIETVTEGCNRIERFCTALK